jgi:hypothetical protein
MNPPSGLRQQQQQQQQQQKQKQKTLRMQKHENTLEFHSRLIEAAEVRFSNPLCRTQLRRGMISPRTSRKAYLSG